MRDAPLVSARAAGIPKPTHSSPPVPALVSLSEALPMMGIALCCVWAAYTTTELPEVATSTVMSPEVVADAAEPLGVVTLAAVLSDAMALAAASSEVMARAAESPEAAVLVSAPGMVVAPSNALSAGHVAVKETVTELYPSSEDTFTFTFMHLADAFIQSDLQCIQAIHVFSVCVFPGNRTHNLLRC